MKPIFLSANTIRHCLALGIFVSGCISENILFAQKFGAAVPWTTYEAEASVTNATILSGNSKRSMVTYEASGRKVVELNSPESFVTITSTVRANRITIRYSIPRETSGTISLYINKQYKQDIHLVSDRIWREKSILPGGYFRFFDEVILEAEIKAGDEIKLVKGKSDNFPSCIIDFIDLELIPAPLSSPDKTWLDVTDFGANGQDDQDDTQSINRCLVAASGGSKKVWIPAGNFYINDQVNVPEGVKLAGAGMWYTIIKKNIPPSNVKRALEMAHDTEIKDLKIDDIKGNVRINGHEGIRVRPNAKVLIDGVWVANTFGAGILGFRAADVIIRNCRVFGTFADAIHLARDSHNCLAENNLVRNSGDDGLAIVTYNSAGCHDIVYRNNTVWFNYWGRGITLIGGDHNILEKNLVVDGAKAGLLIAVEEYNQKITPYVTNFLVQNNQVVRCGDIANQNLGGIWLWGNVQTSPMSGYVRNNEIIEPVRHGITVVNWVPEGVYIQNNTIDEPGPDGKRIYTTLKDGFSPVISNNIEMP